MSRSALAVKDASNVLTFARNAVKSALNVMMNSVRPVTFAANVQGRMFGARTASSAAAVPKFARTAAPYALTAPIRYAPIVASVPVVLMRSALNAAFVLTAPTLCAVNAITAPTVRISFVKTAKCTAPTVR